MERGATTTAASFDAWLDAALNHEIAEPEWYWAEDFDEVWSVLHVDARLAAAYLTRILAHPTCLDSYPLAQVTQGIWFLMGSSSPAGTAECLVRADVPLASRTSCIHAMSDFFERFVLPRAGGPARDDSDPFHIACYMWWDILPMRWGEGEPELHQACLTTMDRILGLPSELCQLSALHGLNHWQSRHPEQVGDIVDRFVTKTPDITTRIREYAASAREGRAL